MFGVRREARALRLLTGGAPTLRPRAHALFSARHCSPPPLCAPPRRKVKARGEVEDAGARGLRAWAPGQASPPLASNVPSPPAGVGRTPPKRPVAKTTHMNGSSGYAPVALSARCVLRACFCKYLSRLSQGKVSYFGSVTPDSTNLSVVALLLVTAEVGAEEAQKRCPKDQGLEKARVAQRRGLRGTWSGCSFLN